MDEGNVMLRLLLLLETQAPPNFPVSVSPLLQTGPFRYLRTVDDLFVVAKHGLFSA